MSNVVTVGHKPEDFSSTATVTYLDNSYNANYTFVITAIPNWLNGINVDGYAWDTTINASASHLIDTGGFYGSNYNAFYINGILIKSIGNYQSVNSTYFISSGSQGGSFAFTLVTNGYTNLQTSDGPNSFGILALGIASGLSIGALVTAISFLIRGRKRK